jgi:hypothetical protein
MKKLITMIAAVAAIAAAHAERIDVNQYFSMMLPNSWQITYSGRGLQGEGMYPVLATTNRTCTMFLSVINAPHESISWEEYQTITDLDLPELAQVNQKVGWSLPKVRKMEFQGIPALVFNHQNNKGYMLSVELWIQDKHFLLNFIYAIEARDTINGILESLRSDGAPQFTGI